MASSSEASRGAIFLIGMNPLSSNCGPVSPHSMPDARALAPENRLFVKYMKSQMLIAAAALVCVATAARLRRRAVRAGDPRPCPTRAAARQKMTRRFAPAEISADVSAAARRRAPRARPSSSRPPASWTRCSCARSGPATTRCCSDLRVAAAPAAPAPARSRARLHYFLINKGPWSRLDHNQPFVPGAPAKPESANFYPADATQGGSRRSGSTRSAATRRRAATGFFTDDPPRRRRQARRRALLDRVPGRARARGGAAPRRRRADQRRRR